jgi:hypothetical protein
MTFWCKTHNSSVGNVSTSLHFMMAPNHDLIPQRIMRRSREVDKEQLFSMSKYCDAQTFAAPRFLRHHVRLSDCEYAVWLFGAMTFAMQSNQCARAAELG